VQVARLVPREPIGRFTTTGLFGGGLHVPLEQGQLGCEFPDHTDLECRADWWWPLPLPPQRAAQKREKNGFDLSC
jgi:hypothetical protein